MCRQVENHHHHIWKISELVMPREKADDFDTSDKVFSAAFPQQPNILIIENGVKVYFKSVASERYFESVCLSL